MAGEPQRKRPASTITTLLPGGHPRNPLRSNSHQGARASDPAFGGEPSIIDWHEDPTSPFGHAEGLGYIEPPTASQQPNQTDGLQMHSATEDAHEEPSECGGDSPEGAEEDSNPAVTGEFTAANQQPNQTGDIQ